MWGEPQTLKADKILACFQEGVWIGGPKSLVLETCTLILIIFKPSASFYLSPSSHAVVGEEGRVAESWDGWALRFPLPLCPGGEAGREAGGGGSGGGTRPGAAGGGRRPPSSSFSSFLPRWKRNRPHPRDPPARNTNTARRFWFVFAGKGRGVRGGLRLVPLEKYGLYAAVPCCDWFRRRYGEGERAPVERLFPLLIGSDARLTPLKGDRISDWLSLTARAGGRSLRRDLIGFR